MARGQWGMGVSFLCVWPRYQEIFVFLLAALYCAFCVMVLTRGFIETLVSVGLGGVYVILAAKEAVCSTREEKYHAP